MLTHARHGLVPEKQRSPSEFYKKKGPGLKKKEGGKKIIGNAVEKWGAEACDFLQIWGRKNAVGKTSAQVQAARGVCY